MLVPPLLALLLAGQQGGAAARHSLLPGCPLQVPIVEWLQLNRQGVAAKYDFIVEKLRAVLENHECGSGCSH
jgi:hypothetical protein